MYTQLFAQQTTESLYSSYPKRSLVIPMANSSYSHG